MHLCLDPLDADLLVDLSNVCSRSLLGGRGEVVLSRLEAGADAFRALDQLEDTWVFAVADESLFRRLSSSQDRRQLRTWVEEGRVEAVPGADERLLELVELTGSPVMTWDRFLGHRDVFDWIQGNTEHFVWVVPDGSGVRAEYRDMQVVDPRLISERAEIDTLKAAHLLDRQGRPDAVVLSRWWRCPKPDCALFGPDHSAGQPAPQRDGGRLLCSLHRDPLQDDGPRGRLLQLKVATDGVARGRVSVAQDRPVVLGRAAGPDLVDLQRLVRRPVLDLVSRRHVRVALRGQRWSVTDLGSSNGSAVVTAAGQARQLKPQVETMLEVTDRVVLAGQIELTVSGRRFPYLARSSSQSQDHGDGTSESEVTRLQG